MKKYLNITRIICACLLLSSCSQDDDVSQEVQIIYPEIVGVWEWVGTINEADSSIESPELSGTTRDIVISETEFTFYINNDIIAQRGYSYTLEISTLTGLEEFIVTFEDDGFRDIVRREDNFINFIDDCEGCYTSIYQLKD